MSVLNKTCYDCLILSGGGAKGSYGAGVAKALDLFRSELHPTRKVCYLGTSAGALNAAVLASKGPDDLINFWISTRKRSILSPFLGWKKQFIYRMAGRLISQKRPFSLYSNRGLIRLLAAHISFQDLHSDLIIITVNYDDSEIEAFYHSEKIDKFLEHDRTLPLDQQRMNYYRKIGDQLMFSDALLASTAIPIAFPPVLINGHLYVDGGVGNNVPSKEAARFLRHIQRDNRFDVGRVYCVKLDPPIRRAKNMANNVRDLALRTWEISSFLRMKSALEGWSRINDEVVTHEAKVDKILFDMTQKYQSTNPGIIEDIGRSINADLRHLGGSTKRLVINLIEIEPSESLGGTLDFDPKKAESNITRGFIDTLNMLRDRGDISDENRTNWIDTKIFWQSR